MSDATDCPRCRGVAAHRLLAALRDGLPVYAAGVNRTSAYGHRRKCATFAAAWDAAFLKGRPRRRERRRELAGQPYDDALPTILDELAEGATRSDAATAAGVKPATERGWYHRYPQYRDAVVYAEHRASARPTEVR